MALAFWLVATTTAVTAINWQNPRLRAVLGMGWGLILLWIFVAGTLMHRFREPIRRAVSSIALDWRLKFRLADSTRSSPRAMEVGTAFSVFQSWRWQA